MFTNPFSKCPKCGETLNSNSTQCSNCKIEIGSYFGEEKDFYSQIFLELAEKNKIISKNDAEIIYEEYKSLLQTEYPQKIEDILLNRKSVSLSQISKLIAGTLRIIDKNFCKEAVKKGIITKSQSQEVLETQKKMFARGSFKSAADLLKGKKLLNDTQIKEILTSDSISGPREKETGYRPLTEMWQEEDKKKVHNSIKNKISTKSLKIAKLAVKYKFIDKEDLEEAASQWSESSQPGKGSFLDFIENKGLIDRKKLVLLNIHYEYENLKEADIQFLKLSLAHKFIKENQAQSALKKQNSVFKDQHKLIPVCKILLQTNSMTPEQIKKILIEQNRKELAQKIMSEPKLPDKDKTVENKKTEILYASKEEIEIEISNDSMKAQLHPLTKKINPEDIKSVLSEKGVIFGIVSDDLIKSYIDEGFDTPVTVASGKPPVYPANAEIKCHFASNYLNVGNIDEEGNIDFMDRGEIPVAEPGQLLAEKIPLKNGKDGIDIFGNEISVEEPIDCLIKPGQGTKTDETGTKIYAVEKGQPHISIDGTVSVFNIHEIKGDVDFHTGHIEFDGNIIIHGSIKSGFRVSGNDITAESATEAIINSKGHVEIKGGITGGKIFAQQGLTAKFVNQADITACGNVNIEKEILESKITTSGIVTVNSGKILSSFVSAKGGVDAKQIGTDVSSPSTIEIGKDSYLEKILAPYIFKLENIDSKIEDIQEKIASTEQLEKQSHIEIAQKAQVQDKANQALKQLKEHYELVSNSGRTNAINEIKAKIDNLTARVAQDEKAMDSLFESQDEYQKTLSKYTSEIKNLMQQKEEVTAQIESVKNYDNAIEPSAVMTVRGTIEKGTKVLGPNSMWKVHETSKNIKASEMVTKDQDGNPVYLIKTDKNK
jgi:hypothetical protein